MLLSDAAPLHRDRQEGSTKRCARSANATRAVPLVVLAETNCVERLLAFCSVPSSWVAPCVLPQRRRRFRDRNPRGGASRHCICGGRSRHRSDRRHQPGHRRRHRHGPGSEPTVPAGVAASNELEYLNALLKQRAEKEARDASLEDLKAYPHGKDGADPEKQLAKLAGFLERAATEGWKVSLSKPFLEGLKRCGISVCTEVGRGASCSPSGRSPGEVRPRQDGY